MKKSNSFLAPFDNHMSNAGKARTMFIVNSDISGKKITAESRYMKFFEETAAKQYFRQKPEDTNKIVAKEILRQQKRAVKLEAKKSKNSFSFTTLSRQGLYESVYKKERVPPQGHYRLNYSLVDKSLRASACTRLWLWTVGPRSQKYWSAFPNTDLKPAIVRGELKALSIIPRCENDLPISPHQPTILGSSVSTETPPYLRRTKQPPLSASTST